MSKFLRKLTKSKKKRRTSHSTSSKMAWMDLDREEDDFDIEDVEEYEDEDAEYEDEEYEDEDAEYEDEEYEDEDAEYEDEEYEDEDAEYEDEEYEDEDVEYEDEEYEDEEYEDEDAEYEDEEYEDDDDEYDDEDDEDEEYVPAYMKRTLKYRLMHMSLVDHIVAFTGVAVLILVVFTAALYLKSKNAENQLGAFAQVGVGMEEINIIGESGLLAIADAQSSKAMAAELEMEEEVEEVRNEEGKIEIGMSLTSIQKDLKIKFINLNTEKLIPSVEFEVEIKNDSGKSYSMKDEDMDGIIYQTGIDPGRYEIKIVSPLTHDNYSIPTSTEAITVRDTIEYKKVDVANEVKTEAQVNAAVEDTQVKDTVVESVNTDTVEWVESTKTLIEGTEQVHTSYEKVDKGSIADPGQSSFAGSGLTAVQLKLTLGNDLTGVPTTAPVEEPTSAPTEAPAEPTAAPTEAPAEEPTQAPAEPTAAPTDTPAEEPTDAPVEVPTEKPTTDPGEGVPTTKPTTDPGAVEVPTATPEGVPTVSPSATPSSAPTETPKPSATPTSKPNDAKNDTTSNLKTTGGEQLYVKDSSGNFREAKYADYYNSNLEFYRKVEKKQGQYKYTGWQNLDGYTYYFDKNGNKVTGEQVIQGAKYTFGSDGRLNTGSGVLGIDVSKWNGKIDWNAVKSSGVSYVIIRCGYRGSTTGALIEDPMFRANIQGATNAGLKVGIYFFTQAMNEVEAVEEASMVLGLIKGYNISYPIFLDVEPSGGRADGISVETRTAVCKAFCQTIQNSGYKAGIYANKTWFNEKINTPTLTSYKLWLAQYAATPSYTRTRYDIWQYSSKGRVSGIGTNVDMNMSYLNY